MQAEPFIIVIAAGVLLVLLSLALDRIWASAIPVREIYYLIRAPGVVLHESSHILGCLLTGAKIQNVVFFSDTGGSVTYARPALPWLGDVVISTAPLFCLPLVLSGITWGFATYLGCIFSPFPETLFSLGSLSLAGNAVITMFERNLITSVNPWFLVYLYLTVSIVLSVAPSMQDLKNAAIGIFLLALFGALIISADIPWADGALNYITVTLGAGFSLGLAFGFIALFCSIPLIAYYFWTRAT
jgi:hypothetical protein